MSILCNTAESMENEGNFVHHLVSCQVSIFNIASCLGTVLRVDRISQQT